MGPSILVPKARETKAFELGAYLLQDRIVFLSDEVNQESATAVVQQLLYLEQQDGKEPIRLFINSPGGSVVDGMAIYDTLRRVQAPVYAVVCGMAASMGAVILSGCEKGHRYIQPHGEVLLHQPLGGARGPATDIQISARRIIKIKDRLLHILADNCGQPYEKVVEDCDRDHWLDADEAIAYGICDALYE